MPACALARLRFRPSALAWSVGLVLAFLLLVCPAVAESAGPTNVSGTISASTTWTLANSPYVLTGDVTVAAGVTLTVEPGVLVQGNASTRTLQVNGSLAAVGTAAAPITFTSTTDSASGQWNGLKFSAGAGTSTLKYVNVRYGGDSGASGANGMVEILGGTITIEDSSFKDSRVSGLTVSGDSTGAGVSLTVRRSTFEHNGFNGAARQGNGLRSFNAPVVIEDSAFWSNAVNGLYFQVGTGYAQLPSQVSGSSIWDNESLGIYILQDGPAAALGPDGKVAGKPGNAVYDNGSFGFSLNEKWYQMSVWAASSEIDWSGTYWGPASYIACGFGSQRGHVSYGVPFPDPGFLLQVPRGPVEYVTDTQGVNYCGNDDVTVNAPAATLPDLYFDAPPPTFGGLLAGSTRGCTDCQRQEQELALAHDSEGGNGIAYTYEPVNTATGSLTELATDLQLAGPGAPFAWTRSYNSQDTSSGALGQGWSHPFDTTLTVVNTSTGELEYHAGSGQLTRFEKLTGGSTGAANYRGKGFDGKLKRLADNTYQLTTRDQRVFTFDTAGKLTSIKPRFLPATTLAYASGKLSSLTDSAGRSISISYSVADPALIEKVTLPDGRYVQYGYTSGRLTSVRDPRAKTWTLSYDASGRLTSIQDPVGHFELQNIQYDSQGRVTSEQNGTGDATTYAYTTSAPYELTTMTIPGRGSWVYKHLGNLLMSVIDPLNRTTTYTYDGMGRKATETDGRGNTSRLEYDAYGNVVKEIAPQPLGYTSSRTFNATNDLLTETDWRGNTTTYAYASSSDAAADYQVGQPKTVTDREGGVSTFKYWTTTSSPAPPATNVGLLKSVTNQRGKTISYEYDSSGNLSKVTSPLGLKTTFGYDGSGRRTSRRDPRGNVPDPPSGFLTQWAYDAVDNVSALTDARGNVTTYEYYDNEVLWKQTRTDTGGAQRVTSFEYDNANRLWKSTDPRNGVETRLYWPDGQLKSIESAEGRKTSYSYDNASQLTSVVEPNGNVSGANSADWTWTYSYDDAGNRTSEAHPDGGSTTIAYDALNRAYQWTDAVSHTTSVEYDANDNVIQRTNGNGHTRGYTYDKLDRLKTETDERGKTWTRAYFSTGQLESVTTSLGFKTSYGIDDDGRTTSMVEARGNVSGGTPSDYSWAYQYDENGNRTRITDPLGNQLNYEHNSLGDVTKITDQRGNESTLAYDVMNRLQRVTPPAAGATGTLYTEYTYDAAGNLATRMDPRGNTTTWTHDLDGRLTRRVTPVGTWNWTYDANGNLKTLETPAGSSTQTAGDGTVTYGYDRMSRLSSVDYSDSTPDVTRTYDLAGRPATMTDGVGGSVTFTHDNADRVTGISRTGASAGLNGTLEYAYDNAGNVTSRTYPDSTVVSQTSDDDGRLATTTSGGQTTSFSYDAAGNLTSITLPSGNGHVATRTFDRAGRLTTVENAKSGTILSRFTWTLDSASNPTKAQTTRGGSDTYDAYEYDARNRLIASCYGIAQAATNCSGADNKITYAYDKVSNRSQEVRTGNVGNTGTIDYTYNDADQLTSTTKSGVTTSYTYDANGNQASAGSRSFTYDLANRLTSTTLGGTTTTYTYDGDDRRISSTTSGGADLRYIWDPLAETGLAELTLERTPSGSLIRRYVNGPLGAVSLTNSSAAFYFHQDLLHNVTDVTDASGSAQWRYEYEAFGAQRSATDVSGTAPENPLRFNNQYFDANTGAYHLRARQYDQTIGRFGAVDPIERPLTSPAEAAYVYASGQPTVMVDPSGEIPEWLQNARREASMIIDWGAEVAGRGYTSVKDIFTGRAGGRLGSHLYDVYEAAGGGRRGRFAVAKTLAGIAVPHPDLCIRAIVSGSRREVSSQCGQAALEVLPFLGACRVARRASRADNVGRGGDGPVRVGQKGERAVGDVYDIGPKVRIRVNGRTRIPDGLTATTVSEVKNTRYVSYTTQLRDFVDYANNTGRRFVLYVRPGATLSKSLLELRKEGKITVREIPSGR